MKKILLSISILMFTFNILLAQTNVITETKADFTVNIIQDSIYNIELVEIPSGILKRKASSMSHAMDIYIESFYFGKFEVTQKLWKEVMGTYPLTFNFDYFSHENARHETNILDRKKEIALQTGFIGDDLPVENISWDEIQIFVKKLSEETGYSYRLPTDAEWEYAYRAGTTSNYYFGDDASMLNDYEWWRENSNGKTHKVGSKKPNPWGLYDMGGNVAEWTFSIADMEPHRMAYPDRIWAKVRRRIYRGSHYLHRKEAASATWVHTYDQVYPHNCVGFRLVREK